ncbi:unnamed protein product [Arctogadus glacialis]
MTIRPGLLMHLPQQNALACRAVKHQPPPLTNPPRRSPPPGPPPRAPRGRSRHADTLVRPSHWPTRTLGGATGGRQTLTGSPPTLEGPT